MEWIEPILPYIQVTFAVLLIAAILMQRSDAGLGSVFGGGDSGGPGVNTKRGFERTLFQATIVLAFLFVISALIEVILPLS